MVELTGEILARFLKQHIGNPLVRVYSYNDFFINRLKEHGATTVLDLAAGTGIDAIHLTMQGFDVTANEFDTSLHKILTSEIEDSGLEIKVLEGFDWRDFPANRHYDASLLIGNSFTYLFPDDRLKALSSFYEITDKVLIVDTRNYDFFLRQGDSVLGESRYPFKRKFYYRCKDTPIYPISISNSEIIFEVHQHSTGLKYQQTFYPIKRDELRDLLRQVGFSKVKIYSDFVADEVSDSEFIQFVATK